MFDTKCCKDCVSFHTVRPKIGENKNIHKNMCIQWCCFYGKPAKDAIGECKSKTRSAQTLSEPIQIVN